ncbi:MAG: response regulator [Dechloromonas sp.]|nr:response regulator [Dechloromonas sp.]
MENTSTARTEVMIVEDTSASLELLCELLTQAGYAVRPAPEGAMALRSAQAKPPELILLDIRMPGIDGFEVCRRLKADARTRDIPVIFLSALRDESDTLRGFALGAVDFIAKPYRPEEVLARVRTHAELRRLQSGLEERVRERTAQLLEAQTRLLESQGRLQELASFLQNVREEERTHIARELHDELGQTLTSLRIDLGWLRDKCIKQGAAVVDRANGAYALVERTIDALRRISEGLRPGMLDVLGLAAAVEHHVTQFEERNGISCTLTMNQEEFTIDGELATAIFRLIQEALTNVLRHAAASQLNVSIDEDEDCIRVSIEDDGQGFQPAQDKKTFGLLGMQERVKMLGGSIAISSQPNAGCRIEATFPKQGAHRK